MKNYFEQIKNIYTKRRQLKISYEYRGINPSKDWFILLVASQILVLVSALMAIYLYTQIDSGKIFIVESDGKESEVTINMNLLEKIVGDINQKEQDTLQTLQVNQNITDPSI
ncbi:MAG: hypothetical protein WAZ44_02045 [Minisyncoccia bacterium]